MQKHHTIKSIRKKKRASTLKKIKAKIFIIKVKIDLLSSGSRMCSRSTIRKEKANSFS